MRILCLSVPHFPVVVEQRDDARLEDQPVILIQDGSVWDCSPDTLSRGVRVGMRRAAAEKLCPEALIRAADIPCYELALESVADVLTQVSPVVEVEGWDELYVDISDQKIPGRRDETALCQEVGRRLRHEVGLSGMMGVAGNKFTAYVAACTVGWGRALLLRPGTEGSFLTQMPVDLLPSDEKMQEELRVLGIRTVGQFARLPIGAVVARFGSEGRRIHRLARGHGRQRLIPYRHPQQVGATRQFEPPLEMDTRLVQRVRQLAHTCCAQLHDQGLACQRVRLIVSFEGGSCRVAEGTLEGLVSDPVVVGASAQELIHSLSRNDRVMELCLELRALRAQRGRQLELDTVSRPANMDLTQLVTPLMTKFGLDRFYQCRVTNSSSPLAELRFAWMGWEGGKP